MRKLINSWGFQLFISLLLCTTLGGIAFSVHTVVMKYILGIWSGAFGIMTMATGINAIEGDSFQILEEDSTCYQCNRIQGKLDKLTTENKQLTEALINLKV